MWPTIFLLFAVAPGKAGHVMRSMQAPQGGLQSFICPLESRHVEVWDRLPDDSFQSRFHQEVRGELPSGCQAQEVAADKMDGWSSFLQVGLNVNMHKRKSHEEVDGEGCKKFRPALVPYPKFVSLLDTSTGSFVLAKDTTVSLGSGISEDAPYVAAALGGLRKRISEATSQLTSGGEAPSLISLGIVAKDGADPEGYKLTVQSGKILLEAYGPAGFSYGVTTLKQLIPLSMPDKGAASLAEIAGCGTTDSGALPPMVIEDAPNFKWRGFHLDLSRHFFPANDVKKLLSTMAEYKMNKFQWHLTDDQGWRFPVKGYPELTRKGAGPRYKGSSLMSSGQGIEGSYTEDEIADVLAFAKAHHIHVIPEVDVPGHVAAAISAYPELGNKGFAPPAGPQHEYGVHQWTLAPTKASSAFLETVFSEVARLFPDSEYIHVGGDEAPEDQWRHSSAEARKHWEHFKGSNAQSYFNRKVGDIIRSKGKKMAGWDEMQSMEGLPKDAVIFAWRGENELRKAIQNGRQAVNADCNHLYLDHYQGPKSSEPKAIGGPLTRVKDVYNYNPRPSWVSEKDKHLVLGGQAQLWSEYFPNWKQVEYMAWPRAIALAERLWTPDEEASYPDFSNRLTKRLNDLKLWGVDFHTLEA